MNGTWLLNSTWLRFNQSEGCIRNLGRKCKANRLLVFCDQLCVSGEWNCLSTHMLIDCSAVNSLFIRNSEEGVRIH